MDQIRDAASQIMLLTGCCISREIQVSNYVFSTTFANVPDLSLFYTFLNQPIISHVTADLNPELFPALILVVKSDSNVKCILFCSGKAIITGCREERLGHDAHNTIIGLINGFNASNKMIHD